MYSDNQTPRLTKSVVSRPRILLVDDHPGILKRVPALLKPDFEVAAPASSGREALDLVNQVNPDVIILDISMPDLDGFQTKLALDQAGSRIPVVFLSTSDAEEDIGKAFRCGGRGYVLKHTAARDLPSALEQVLAGRAFVPSLPSLFEFAKDGDHTMQLYRDLEPFLDNLASFLSFALLRGDATCVIANEAIREGVTDRLRESGWDRHERYRVMDANPASILMANGLPDVSAVEKVIAELDQYRRDKGEGSPPRLTVFGDVVGPLLAEANAAAAIELEALWTRLTRDLPWLALCAYPASVFEKAEPDFWERVCTAHHAIGHASDL